MIPNSNPQADPLSPERLAEYRKLAEQITADPWVLSDCEGWLKVWRESALTNVTRDESGAVDGFSEPSSYPVADLVVEIELDSWDPGEDATDDEIRANIGSLFTARDALPALLAENDRLSARVSELEAKTARRGARLVALENDALNMRGALSPNGFPRRVPMELGETLTPVVEWLLDRVAELEKSAQTRHCGRAMVHPEHRWMSARESVQCPGTEAGA